LKGRAHLVDGLIVGAAEIDNAISENVRVGSSRVTTVAAVGAVGHAVHKVLEMWTKKIE
jgi:hypothetical protein